MPCRKTKITKDSDSEMFINKCINNYSVAKIYMDTGQIYVN